MSSDTTASSDSTADPKAEPAGGCRVNIMELSGKVRAGGIVGAGMISLLSSGNSAKNQ
jgi:hypothetical protein